VSVDKTEEMPRRLARREDTVDFPVPDVPPNRMIIGIVLSEKKIIYLLTCNQTRKIKILFNRTFCSSQITNYIFRKSIKQRLP